MDRDDVISTLNDLIETSRDGEEGFRQCADTVKNPNLKTVLRTESGALPRSRDAVDADRPRDGRRSGEEQLDERHDAPVLGQHAQLDLRDERSRDPRRMRARRGCRQEAPTKRRWPRICRATCAGSSNGNTPRSRRTTTGCARCATRRRSAAGVSCIRRSGRPDGWRPERRNERIAAWKCRPPMPR